MISVVITFVTVITVTVTISVRLNGVSRTGRGGFGRPAPHKKYIALSSPFKQEFSSFRAASPENVLDCRAQS
jgi:hypothetical protein